MKLLRLTLCLTLATAMQAEVIALKGINGKVLDFDLREVDANGVRGVPAGHTEVMSIPWRSLDLTWLKRTNPALDRKREEAVRASDPLGNATPPTTLAQVRTTLRTALWKPRELGWPRLKGASKARQDALQVATYGNLRTTSPLKVLIVAADRNHPAQRDALFWIKESSTLIDALSTAFAIAAQQAANLPPDGETRTFIARLKEAEAALQEMRSNPIVENAEWTPILRRALESFQRT